MSLTDLVSEPESQCQAGDTNQLQSSLSVGTLQVPRALSFGYLAWGRHWEVEALWQTGALLCSVQNKLKAVPAGTNRLPLCPAPKGEE